MKGRRNAYAPCRGKYCEVSCPVVEVGVTIIEIVRLADKGGYAMNFKKARR